ncbi:hypothetical protein CR155_20255 [Pollutimonas nitritireducens]|uniref:HTH cro/C1-type domain-containing protein n=1 Tax=Pollutimonas nitritireducens TaxID=2045209 RepID=A0A2N4UAJ0_9BURK|nr:helix-turn-helix transcriptional regulator [Pollutimonas nitritireducens]PLC52032.1 hypothetical protein CR155_20255 [Pollutimonas nitritireducens]
MPTTLSEIALALREQAKRLEITDEALRKKAGISRQALTKVMCGESDVKVVALLAVADRLGVEVVLLPKSIAGAFADELSPMPPLKTKVQAIVERFKN